MTGDGLATGDRDRAVLRQFVIAAAEAQHGAIAHARCLLAESDERPVERAVRHALGAEAERVDVMVAVHAAEDPAEHHFRRALAGESTAHGAEHASDALRERGATRLVDCTLIAAPVTGDRAAITLRVAAPADVSADDLAGVLSRAAQPPAITVANLERIVPKLSPNASLRVMHGATEQGWAPIGCTITLDWPVRRTLQAGTNLAMLLGACDGRTNARALHAAFADNAGERDDLSAYRFADVLRRLVVDGYITVEPAPAP